MRASLQDAARVRQAGYKVERFDSTGHTPGWVLLDPEGANLMIGDHGCVAPTQWEAIAEGLKRIEDDERDPEPPPVEEFVPPSVAVLREQGPLSIRDLTALTAARLGCSLGYDDVLAVMERERRASRVVQVTDGGDYRNRIWRAI